MDRANVRKNLEALAEEEDEEDLEGLKGAGDDDSDTESSDEDDSGVRRGEPNKFDGLCDGLLNAMALVHCALKDVLDMKDELLKHALPPTVLIHLSMTTSKLFRSVSDLGMPVNELVRLVRVYSTPWEEKSAALKKLHEDYEGKQRQLNIAIKRLQLVDAHSKRIAREKRVMNWEKLFAKLTSTKGHGRRWKFLIETIKQKAKMGLEHVQAYTQALEESSESEDEDVPTQAPTTRPEVGDVGSENQSEEFEEGDQESRGGDNDGGEEDEDDDEDDDEKEEEEEDGESKDQEEADTASEVTGPKFSNNESDVPTVTIHLANNTSDEGSDGVFSRTGSPKKVRFEEEKVQVIKPQTTEVDTSTAAPDYDRSLFVRIFCPEGLEEQAQLRCTLTCNGQMFKTGILDTPEEEEVQEEVPEQQPRRPRAAGNVRQTPDGPPQTAATEGGAKKSKKFKEFELKLPDDAPPGTLKLKHMAEDPENLQIAVHHGQYEELFAMATIDFADIRDLPLQTVFLPPPAGDDVVLRSDSQSGSLSDVGDFDDLSDSIDLMLPDEGEQGHSAQHHSDPARDIDALPFPLYSLHAAKADALHKPCGTLPLVMYWGKRERPHSFNRQTGTLGVYDLVFDMTGIDLNTTTKEDLHKETTDRSASAFTFTPEVQEETVAKDEYERLVNEHQEELQYLQEEYEKRLQEVMQSLQAVQEENIALSQQQQQQILRPLSSASRGSRGSTPAASPGPVTFHSPVTAKKVVSPPTLKVEKTMSDVTGAGGGGGGGGGGDRSLPETASSKLRPLPPKTQKTHQRNFRIGRPLPKWGEHLPQDFFERLQLFEEESKARKQELNERTLREIKDSLEKKLSGQHKLSKREEQMYDALKDVSLPALFMPIKTGNIFNPRAHQYFHPTGTTEMRLTQPPSVFQLPPLPHNNKLSVVNLFELSKNFHNRGPDWLMDRYIQQQHPLSSSLNYPQTPAPTTSIPHQASAQRSARGVFQEPHLSADSPEQDGISHSAHVSVPEQEV